MPSLLTQLVAFFSAPPGSLLYYLAWLFALALGASISVSRWRQIREPSAARLALALSGLFFVQVGYGIVLLASEAGWRAGRVWLPPSDRALSALTVLTMVWLLAFPKAHRAADAVGAGLGIITILSGGLATLLWAQALTPSAYNNSPQEIAWEWAQLLALGGGIGLVLIRRRANWGLSALVLSLWLTGHALHYWLATIPNANEPGMVRVWMLLATPAWLAVIYQRAHSGEVAGDAFRAAQNRWLRDLDEVQTQLRAARAEIARQREEIGLLVERVRQAANLAPPPKPQPIVPKTLDDLRAKLQTQGARPEEQTALEAELDAARRQIEELAQAQSKFDAVTEELEQARQQMAQLQRELELSRTELVKTAQRPLDFPTVTKGRAAQDVVVLVEALTSAQNKLADQAVEISDLREAVTERDRRLTEYEKAKPRLQADMELLASLSQELRQPMSSVVGYIDVLLSESMGIVSALQRKFLDRIRISIERMGVLLDDLIRVIDIDTGNLRLAADTVNVPELLQEVVRFSEPLFREKELQLDRDIATDLPPVRADRDAVLQILSHLVTNMGQASRPHTAIKLTLHGEADPAQRDKTIEYLVLAASDTGGGIAPTDQARVFSRIYRAEAPPIAGVGDNGMGLSIAKALIEAHGGRIWFTTEAGVGSTFYVLLPVDGKVKANGHGAKPG
jgi:signal transduction histidine kinase